MKRLGEGRIHQVRHQLAFVLFLLLYGPLVRVLAENCSFSISDISVIESEDDAEALFEIANCTDLGDINVSWSGKVTLRNSIVVGRGTFLHVNGSNSAEAVGAFGRRMFQVKAGGSLEIFSLRLTGGTEQEGGAIYSIWSNVKLVNCEVDHNASNEGSGGAVFVAEGELEIVGGKFHNNSALRDSEDNGGGAVYTRNSNLTVVGNTHFQTNSARRGGAIYCAKTQDFDSLVYCDIEDATFMDNMAEMGDSFDLSAGAWSTLFGGGAISFSYSTAYVSGCIFERNFATPGGGAIFGGLGTRIVIHRCTFRENETQGYGAAVAGSDVQLNSSVIENNVANLGGAGVFLMLVKATELTNITCSNNIAASEDNDDSPDGDGGCLYVTGSDVYVEGARMLFNGAGNGGCLYATNGSDVRLVDGVFTDNKASGSGGVFYAGEGVSVEISQALVERNVGGDGGVGFSTEDAGSVITLYGKYMDNQADNGGVFYIGGVTHVIGGEYSGNMARFDGGSLFVNGGTLTCEGAMFVNNKALESGGGIYTRLSDSLSVSCDLVDNDSPNGAGALVERVDSAYFWNMTIGGNVYFCGSSALFAVESNVILSSVTFNPSDDAEEESIGRPLFLDVASTIYGHRCNFVGWKGEAVVESKNTEAGSVVLDSCDFTTCSPTVKVVASDSVAVVRNAKAGRTTYARAENRSSLVDSALSCTDLDACGEGACMDSPLGVFCQCLPSGACVDGDAEVEIEVPEEKDGSYVTGADILFDIGLRTTGEVTSDVMWKMTYESDTLDAYIVPSAGILSPGGNVTLEVTGTPIDFEAGGADRFVMTFRVQTSWDDENSTTQASDEARVERDFYYCDIQQFAILEGDDDDSWTCLECLEPSIEGEVGGVNCTEAGATFASLHIRRGFWRESNASNFIHACLNSESCRGGGHITSSDDYCNSGHEGPYCAVCSDGYGRGPDRSCYSCSGYRTTIMIAIGAFISLLLLVFLVIALVFLVWGLDAVGSIRHSIRPGVLSWTRARREKRDGSVPESGATGSFQACPTPRLEPGTSSVDDGVISECRPKHEAAVTLGAEWSPVHAGRPGGVIHDADLGESYTQRSSLSRRLKPATRGFATRTFTAGLVTTEGVGSSPADEGRRRCCNMGGGCKKLLSKVPWDKLRILVVVLQILTIYPTVATVEYPPVYSRFLNWLDFVNLDIGSIFSASCLVPSMGHYETLLATTLGPLVIAAVLLITYRLALRKAGSGPDCEARRRMAWTRHFSAGLLVSFLVFTSASTAIFQTFACDGQAVSGKRFLRADYRLECDTTRHIFFQIYAGVMILLYPIGIPAAYFWILWKNRDSLKYTPEGNPEPAIPGSEVDFDTETRRDGAMASKKPRRAKATTRDEVDTRRLSPDLAPSALLWKDYCPDLYYFEVVECGRRILLTGALVFIMPNTTEQAAIACIMAFASLLGFELMRPHMDHTDSWLYRLGCVVIFLSNYLSLLIKVRATEERQLDLLGALLVFLNVALFVAVAFSVWLTTSQSMADPGGDMVAFEVARTMVGLELSKDKGVPGARSTFSEEVKSGRELREEKLAWEIEPDPFGGEGSRQESKLGESELSQRTLV